MGCSGTAARLYRAPLPRDTARRDALTELDCDNEALREQHRKAILSDKGSAPAACRVPQSHGLALIDLDAPCAYPQQDEDAPGPFDRLCHLTAEPMPTAPIRDADLDRNCRNPGFPPPYRRPARPQHT